MILIRRRNGSQRARRSINVALVPNLGGESDVTFLGEDGVWYTFKPENAHEARELADEAALAAKHWRL